MLGREAIAAGMDVFSVPGPSAVVAALSVSGLPSDRFTFAGFPPQPQGGKTRFLQDLKDLSGTVILYESPNRIVETLSLAVDVLGADRPAVLARELTKKFEEVRRGTLGSVLESCVSDKPRGELVLLIGEGDKTVSQEDLDTALREALEHSRLKDAAQQVSERFGVSRRDLYQRGLELQNDG